MCFQLIYISKPVHPLGDLSDLDILKTARAFNAKHDITGFLTRDRRYFAQVLEGSEPVVEALYADIRRDPRHYDPQVLRRSDEQSRHFRGWSMGYLDLGPSGKLPDPLSASAILLMLRNAAKLQRPAAKD